MGPAMSLTLYFAGRYRDKFTRRPPFPAPVGFRGDSPPVKGYVNVQAVVTLLHPWALT
jgi:hypothetical protein